MRQVCIYRAPLSSDGIPRAKLIIYGPHLKGDHPDREVLGPIEIICEIALRFLLSEKQEDDHPA